MMPWSLVMEEREVIVDLIRNTDTRMEEVEVLKFDLDQISHCFSGWPRTKGTMLCDIPDGDMQVAMDIYQEINGAIV
jgi:hypothetical protein